MKLKPSMYHNNLRQRQLDLYNKKIIKEESVFRMIVGVGDKEKSTLQIADGYLNVKGKNVLLNQ